MAESISKVWAFLKPSFIDRPNPVHGAGLTAFRKEWEELSDVDKAQIRQGIENGSFNYA